MFVENLEIEYDNESCVSAKTKITYTGTRLAEDITFEVLDYQSLALVGDDTGNLSVVVDIYDPATAIEWDFRGPDSVYVVRLTGSVSGEIGKRYVLHRCGVISAISSLEDEMAYSEVTGSCRQDYDMLEALSVATEAAVQNRDYNLASWMIKNGYCNDS